MVDVKSGEKRMKELHQVVSHKLAEMINNGHIEKIIEKNIQDLVESSVATALQPYGDFGKFINNKVEQSIAASQDDISLPLYNNFIAERVNAAFKNALEETALARFDEMVTDILQPVPKTSTFSELLAEIREHWMPLSKEGEIHIECEHQKGVLRVKIKNPEYDWEDIKIVFYNFRKETWQLGSLSAGDKALSGNCKNHAGAGLGDTSLSDLLFKYYLTGTEFVADEKLESIYEY